MWMCAHMCCKLERTLSLYCLAQSIFNVWWNKICLNQSCHCFLPQQITLFIPVIVIPFPSFVHQFCEQWSDGSSVLDIFKTGWNFVSKSLGEFCLVAPNINSTQSIQLCDTICMLSLQCSILLQFNTSIKIVTRHFQTWRRVVMSLHQTARPNGKSSSYSISTARRRHQCMCAQLFQISGVEPSI